MSTKMAIWIGMFVCSTLGSFVPTIFGAGWLSYWSILGNGIGGLVGIYVGYKVSKL